MQAFHGYLIAVVTVETDLVLFDSYKATPTLRSHQESAIHFHHVIIHAFTQSCSTTLPEEKCGAHTNLNPSQVNADTDSGTASKWHERCFLLSCQRLVQEAKTIETVVCVRHFNLTQFVSGVLTDVDSTRLMDHDVWCKPECSHRYLLGYNSRPLACLG